MSGCGLPDELRVFLKRWLQACHALAPQTAEAVRGPSAALLRIAKGMSLRTLRFLRTQGVRDDLGRIAPRSPHIYNGIYMIRFSTAGESHGEALIALVSGLPAGVPVDLDFVNHELWRRQQGYGRGGRMKIETDQAHVSFGRAPRQDHRLAHRD